MGDSAERQISNNFLTIHIGGRMAESANRLDDNLEWNMHLRRPLIYRNGGVSQIIVRRRVKLSARKNERSIWQADSGRTFAVASI